MQIQDAPFTNVCNSRKYRYKYNTGRASDSREIHAIDRFLIVEGPFVSKSSYGEDGNGDEEVRVR